jgi:hypothetical protein
MRYISWAGLWWLLGVSVRKVAGFALYCCIFPSRDFHRWRDARAFRVPASLVQMPSTTQMGMAGRKVFFKHVKNVVTLGTSSRQLLQHECSSQEAALGYSWCNPPRTGTEMLCIPCFGETHIPSLSGDALMRSCQIEVDVGPQDTIQLLFMEDQHMVRILSSSTAPPNMYCSRPNCHFPYIFGISSSTNELNTYSHSTHIRVDRTYYHTYSG